MSCGAQPRDWRGDIHSAAKNLVALVRAGALFHKGKHLERPVEITPDPSPDTPVSEVA
ncbi:hypothetical protein P3H15_50880 [Rhodococcus sp. T2V]|uniref:hypothetical protein n=1 Tax=Rhodococcus sp. T2V TaxID=3034164 RepID=UPI0023E0CA11|nr:hypothetical protein [Rhodococcus sp. T2V]MDF3313225.1 hypothetical protein [Rhodococcus sp. T2V]